MTARTVGSAAAVGMAISLAMPETSPLVTVPQADALRSLVGPPSVDVSADGRYVAFESYARLAPADTNSHRDVYVLDRASNRVTLETPDSEVDCMHPRISSDGRYVVYQSSVRTDGPSFRTEVFVRDRSKALTKLLTTAVGGKPADGGSRDPVISDDGRIVAFASAATNLVAGGDANGSGEDIYAVDMRAGSIHRVSVDNAGRQPSRGASFAPSVSADGRAIAFSSSAPLDHASTAGEETRPGGRRPLQIFLRDEALGTTVQVGVPPRGGADGESWSSDVSGDGRYVAFVSNSTNLVPTDRNHCADVFLFDRRSGATVLVSRGTSGTANGESASPAVSTDGRFVAFQSDASDLGCPRRCGRAREDINLLWDVFVFDRETESITRLSDDALGGWMEPSVGPALDATGSVLAFSSRHPINASDRANDFDLFLHAPEVPTTARRK